MTKKHDQCTQNKFTQDSSKTLITEHHSPDIYRRKSVKSGLGMFILQMRAFACRRKDEPKNRLLMNW